MTSLDLPYIHDSSSLACRNSYCVHLNVSNSLLPLTVFGRESCLKICYPLEQSTRYEISLQFLVYIIRFERILKTRSRSSIRIPKKRFYRLEKHSKLPFFLPTSFSDNYGQKSWDTFAFLGRFPMHTGPTPPLTPQTINVGRVYPEFFPSFNFV